MVKPSAVNVFVVATCAEGSSQEFGVFELNVEKLEIALNCWLFSTYIKEFIYGTTDDTEYHIKST